MTPTQKARAEAAAARPEITKQIVALEQKYGESVVSGAYNRHRAIRSARRKLLAQKREVDAKIRKLKA
jgi:hypothetical protein